MYEDLDKFLDHASALTIKDIVEDYKVILGRALENGVYFIDEESKTCFGAFETGGKWHVFRLEQEGHRFTRKLLRKILEVGRELQKTGMPVEVRTKACFWNEQVKKLLKLTHFETVSVQDGYYISIFRG